MTETASARALRAAGAPKRGSRGHTCPHCRQPWVHRSDADHGMFWAIIHRAFENWPEDHSYCPNDINELYGWLLVEAKHSVSGEIKDRNINAIRKSARTFFNLTGESDHDIYYMRLEPTKSGVRVTIPKSLSYKKAGKRKFEEVRSLVYEIIEVTLNTNIENLKREARAA